MNYKNNSTLRPTSLIAWACLGLGIAAFCTAMLSLGSNDDDVSRQVLLIKPENLCFDGVWSQNKYRRTIPIKNTLDETVCLSKLSTSCNCTSIEPQGLSIAPHGTGTIIVEINLSPPSQREAKVSHWTFSSAIRTTWESNTYHGSNSWELKGTVKNAISLDKYDLNFGTVPCENAFLPKTVLVNSFIELKGLQAESKQVNVNLLKKTDYKDGLHSYELLVKPLPTNEIGPFEFEVSLLPISTSDDTPIPPLALKVRGKIHGDACFSPEEVAFPATKIGEILEETIAISPYGNSSFEVTGIQSNNENLVIKPCAVNTKKPNLVLYRVRQKITQRGFQENHVTFEIRGRNKGKAEADTVSQYRIPVCYFGIE